MITLKSFLWIYLDPPFNHCLLLLQKKVGSLYWRFIYILDVDVERYPRLLWKFITSPLNIVWRTTHFTWGLPGNLSSMDFYIDSLSNSRLEHQVISFISSNYKHRHSTIGSYSTHFFSYILILSLSFNFHPTTTHGDTYWGCVHWCRVFREISTSLKVPSFIRLQLGTVCKASTRRDCERVMSAFGEAEE